MLKEERKPTHPSRLGDLVSRLVDDAAFLGIRCLVLSCMSFATFSLFLRSLDTIRIYMTPDIKSRNHSCNRCIGSFS